MADDDDDDIKMQMYEAQAIVIEKEAEIEELRQRIADLTRSSQGEASSSRTENDDDIKMQMYEAQAIVIEQREEIEKLNRTIAEIAESTADKVNKTPAENTKSQEGGGKNITTTAKSTTSIAGFKKGFLLPPKPHPQMEGETSCSTQAAPNNPVPKEVPPKEEKKPSSSVQQVLKNPVTKTTSQKDENKGSSSVQEENSTILVMAGARGLNVLKCENEILMLKKNSAEWKKLALNLPDANLFGGVVYLNDTLYVFGGLQQAFKLFKLDRQLNWIQMAKMGDNRIRAAINNSSLVFQGCIWVLGGFTPIVNQLLNTVERYCPKKNKWFRMPPMREARMSGAAVDYNEKIIICGGINIGGASDHKSVECYDPVSKVWTLLTAMPTPMGMHFAVIIGDSLFAVGGNVYGYSTQSCWQMKNPDQNDATWKSSRPMRETRMNHTGVLLGNELYVFGGASYGHVATPNVEIFNGESWRQGPSLPNSCLGMSSVVIPDHFAEILCNYRK